MYIYRVQAWSLVTKPTFLYPGFHLGITLSYKYIGFLNIII